MEIHSLLYKKYQSVENHKYLHFGEAALQGHCWVVTNMTLLFEFLFCDTPLSCFSLPSVILVAVGELLLLCGAAKGLESRMVQVLVKHTCSLDSLKYAKSEMSPVMWGFM